MKRLAIAVALAIFAGMVPQPAHGLDTCASRAEFARVKINGTMSPAVVQNIFGIPGRRVAYGRSRTGVHTTIYHYKPCDKSIGPFVTFRGSKSRPATAVAKRWRP